MIKTDLCIVGSGPVALFAIYDAGQFAMHCHLIEESPDENLPVSSPQDTQLSTILMDKISAYHPGFSIGEYIENVRNLKSGHYLITTNKRTRIRCKSVLFVNKSAKHDVFD